MACIVHGGKARTKYSVEQLTQGRAIKPTVNMRHRKPRGQGRILPGATLFNFGDIELE